MTDIAIKVENLSKRYRIGLEEELPDTLVGAVTQAVKQPLRNWRQLRRLTRFNDEKPTIDDRRQMTNNPPSSTVHRPSSNVRTDVDRDTLWALRDVSFEVKRGEVVGIIGRNGAGKSTLLKILARITHPTSGRAVINGRVGSLLEVGTGFHSELTGRENIYLNGTILGMTKAEVDRKFDQIVAFSGVEKFIDTPVKRYSSGMRVRLAFSVAAHLEPEILLVDEVLAVGDISFQKKCFGKMGEVAELGRTVMLVSHNMGAIQSLCKRTIVLSRGEIEIDSQTDTAVQKYISDSMNRISTNGVVHWSADQAPGEHGFFLKRIEITSLKTGDIQTSFNAQEEIGIRIYYQIKNQIKGMRLVIQILTQMGVVAFTSTDHSIRVPKLQSAGSYISKCSIPGFLLNNGNYIVRVWSGVPGVKRLLNPGDYLSISITGGASHGSLYKDYNNWPGVVCPKLKWEIVENGK